MVMISYGSDAQRDTVRSEGLGGSRLRLQPHSGKTSDAVPQGKNEERERDAKAAGNDAKRVFKVCEVISFKAAIASNLTWKV